MMFFRRLHRWLGLGLGVFLAVLGLSGSWLIYERELASPAFELQPANRVIPLEALYRQAARQLPAADIVVRFPQSRELPYQFWADERQVVMDQYTGRILAVRDAEFWPYGWMFHLHTELLLGKPGEIVTGWLTVGLLLLIVLGVALWWPKRWKQAFRLRLDKSRFVLHHDLHRQLGVILAPVLLLAAVTGLSLSWSSFVSDTINAVFGQEKNSPPRPVAPPADGEVVTLDAIMAIAHAALPGGRVGIMTVPASITKPVVVRKRMDGDPHPNGLDLVQVSRKGGTILQVTPLAHAEPARRWFNWAYPLHTGQALQPWHHWVLLVVGCLPAFLLTTGLCMYLIKRKEARF